MYGEGIFLELREDRLSRWETRSGVAASGSAPAPVRRGAARRNLRERQLADRPPMLHTLAHLLINQLTFECGYSSASLRKRLYVSPPPRPMAGVLIYTAAGDVEGTMGGLVRMGRPAHLTRIIAQAIEGATWCSADPVHGSWEYKRPRTRLMQPRCVPQLCPRSRDCVRAVQQIPRSRLHHWFDQRPEPRLFHPSVINRAAHYPL